MKYYCFVIMLMFVPTTSAVDNAIVPHQPGALINGAVINDLFNQDFAQEIANAHAWIAAEQQRRMWHQIDQSMHNLYKKVYPAGLLFLMYHEEPAKGAALALAYLFQVL